LCDSLFQRTIEPCRKAVSDAKLATTDIDEVVLVGGSTRIPKVQELVRGYFGKEPHKGVNPDEVVSLGAAVQGGVLTGEVKDVLLLDVTPLSLGLETLGGVMTRIVERNTTVPAKRSQVFSTAEDNQMTVEVHVLQGEREMAGDNRTLGRFHLSGLLAAPRGLPQIEVTFNIDANGILHVSAKDLATNKEQAVTITASTGLSETDIQTMVKDAESHAEGDRKRKEEVETRNHLDSLVYGSEKTFGEGRERLGTEDVGAMEDALSRAKDALKGGDVGGMKEAEQELTRVSHRVAEILYKSAQGGQQAYCGANCGSEKHNGAEAEDDAIDAEYEDLRKSA